jgi:Cof subfamily protein (haloacid dehalogenase superfamily)
MIKLVALDLDRTTLNSQARLSSGNRKALVDAAHNGVHICIASGRCFDSLPEDVLAVKEIEYAITGNGAAVYYIPEKKRIHSFALPVGAADRVMDLVEKMAPDIPHAFETFVDGVAYAWAEYVENPDGYGTTQTAIPYVKRTRTPVKDFRGFVKAHDGNLDGLDLVISNEQMKQKIYDQIKKEEIPVYLTSSVKQLLEMSNPEAGKHSGLKVLMDVLNVKQEEIAAFGDADNDIDMLKFAGTGIAMANASEKALAVADEVTVHHDNDGVAYGLKNILHVI